MGEINQFRIGIVGVGLISLQSHIPAALSFPDIKVVAFIDPAVERARQDLSMFGIEAKIVPDVKDVCAELDGVIIATPNHTHCPIATYCLQQGIHVLIEKPIAVNVEEGKRIVEVANANGLVAAVGYCTRFRENVILTKSVIENEYFGKVTGFAYQFGTPGGWASYSGYHLNAGSAGGGVLMVSGSHFIDRMLHFFGYPQGFSYWDDSQGGPEANAKFEANFSSLTHALKGAARFSKTVRLPGGLVIQTTKGKLILQETDDDPLMFFPKDQPQVKLQVFSNENDDSGSMDLNVFQRQLRDYVDACRNGTKPKVSAEEGVQSLELMQALYQKKMPMDMVGQPMLDKVF